MNKFKFFLCILMAALSLVACDDDEGMPVITGVTTTKGEEYFTEADRGVMIVIEGENLGGATAVLINDQEVYLNPTYNTSTHIIVSIPSDLTLTAEDSELRGEIRVVTNHGEGSYAFHIKAPEQWMTEVQVEREKQADGSLLAKAGGTVTITGKNFYDVERVVITDGISGAEYELTGVAVNKAFDQITATLPATLPDDGWIVLECRTNSSKMEWVRSAFAAPTITSISNDMPIAGCPVVITGESFFKVTGVDVCGEYMIAASDLQVADDGTSITFSLTSAPTSGGELSVVTASGKASVEFYANAIGDGGDSAPLSFDWGAEPYDNGGLMDGAPDVKSGKCWGINSEVKSDANIWWWGKMYMTNLTWPTGIDDSTPLAQVSMRMECWVDHDATRFSFRCYDSDSYAANTQNTVDYLTGECPLRQWFTMEIPLTTFNAVTATYGDWRAAQDGIAADNQGRLVISTDDVAVGKYICTYFDNIRLVVK